MIQIAGKYNTAKVFTDTADEATKKQIETFMNQQSLEGSRVRIMPDCHAGKGCVIGTTMTIKDKIIPNVVGVDISCGVYVVELDERVIDLERLDKCIRNNVPSGSNIRRKEHRWAHEVDLEELRCFNKLNGKKDFYRAVGSLGGGNHYLELNQDAATDKYYFVIHTGSRNLGKQVAEYYQQAAYDDIHKPDKYHKARANEQKQHLIDTLKAEGKSSEIDEVLKHFMYDPGMDWDLYSIPYELCYCQGQLFDDYIHDMKILAKYANLNRRAIADTVGCGMRWKVVDEWETVHNYIDTDNMILRKGAISAQKGEKVIIPMNMRDGSLICIGKGNPDWNYSAPHGAGRLMSRKEARESLSMADFKESMKDVYSTSVTSSTIDEAPMAYKPMQEIIDNIQDTVEIVNIIKPAYNYKDH